jgi:hypothetical protein
MDKGASDAKNSIDNPENAGDNIEDSNREKFPAKKDVQNQLDASNTQSFKVTTSFSSVFMFAQFLFLPFNFFKLSSHVVVCE